MQKSCERKKVKFNFDGMEAVGVAYAHPMNPTYTCVALMLVGASTYASAGWDWVRMMVGPQPGPDFGLGWWAVPDIRIHLCESEPAPRVAHDGSRPRDPDAVGPDGQTAGYMARKGGLEFL